MVVSTSDVFISIQESDLITPSTTALYSLGTVLTVDDGSGYIKQYMYVLADSNIAAKEAMQIIDGVTAGAQFTTQTPAATATATCYGGVANVAIPSGYYGFLQIKGKTTCVSTGATTLGNTVDLADTLRTVTDSGAATITTATLGIVNTNAIGSADVEVNLIGERIIIV
jgi:hypothetical protein